MTPLYYKLSAFLTWNVLRNTKLFLKREVRTKFDIYVVLLSLGRYHCWLTISPRGYHSPSSQCLRYHCWLTISPRGYHSPNNQCLRYHCWLTISLRWYHSPNSQCLRYHCWLTISPRRYHSPSSQYFVVDMVY